MATMADNYRARIGTWLRARLLRNPKALKIDAEGLDLFVVRDVVTRAECDDLIRLIESNLVPSGLMSPTPDPEFRTSQSCNFDQQDPLVVMLEGRIQAIVGIQPELGEGMQGQRYAVGQQFKPHWDAFFPTEPYWPAIEASGGQRTWTAMLFLNDVEGGGQTVFTEAAVSIRPRAGNLVVWNNLDEAGEINPKAKHCGSPVEAGLKYVITKWYRERAWSPLPADVPTY